LRRRELLLDRLEELPGLHEVHHDLGHHHVRGGLLVKFSMMSLRRRISRAF
jgi:hypothetical protein